jgi:two-component system, chemotaxis family, chemotaxis protein CheY
MARRILTADDSASIRAMVRFSLETEGCEIAEARDGAEALDRLEFDGADMLITDLDMPRLDGFELVRKVRAMPQYRHLPILILTTESNDDFKTMAKAAGATGWITKPFRPDQLSKMVELLLASLRGF